MTAAQEKIRVPEVVERFIKALVVADKAVGLYPVTSEIPQQATAVVLDVLREASVDGLDMSFAILKTGFVYEGAAVLASRNSVNEFALALYNRRVSEIRFHVGATADDILGFLAIVKEPPAVIDEEGGFAARLWESGITGVSVVEVRVMIVDTDGLVGIDRENLTPLTRAEIDRAIGMAGAAGRRDALVIARFFGDSKAISEYLSGLWTETGSAKEVAARLSMLANMAQDEEIAQYGAPANLSDALKQIDRQLASQVLLQEVMPDVKSDSGFAEILRQTDVESLFDMIISGTDPSDPPSEAIARAIRRSTSLYAVPLADIEYAATAAMRRRGYPPHTIETIIGMVRPETLRSDVDLAQTQYRATEEELARAQAMEHHFRQVAPGDVDQIPGIEGLRLEAARGVTEGDIALVLVDVIGNDVSHDHFDAMMGVLESSLNAIVDRGLVDVAAEVAEVLTQALGGTRVTEWQRYRVEGVIESLARPSEVKAVVESMRANKAGSQQRKSAERLLELLGGFAIDPLMDQLAQEQEMTGRKQLIDVLSKIAPTHIEEIGKHTNDDRWFVVRNVVAIMASVRHSSTLPYFERTLRHRDSRVRRETIRALSGIQDSHAHQMLITALSDEDPRNIQVAARYLGSAKVEIAVPALERVARGEGPGGGEIGPRIDAIEALGRIAAVSSLPLLNALAGRRLSLIPGRTKEIKVASELAIGRIKNAPGVAR